MFSGIPDPQWQIPPDSSNYQNIKILLMVAKNQRATYLPEQMPAQLGYKGFLVLENGQDQAILILGPKTIELQEELLESMPAGKIPESLEGQIAEVIKSGTVLPYEHIVKRVAPKFAGANIFWNKKSIRETNNCYNYGNDKATNTYAQPGRGSGKIYGAKTKKEIKQASKRDGLVEVQPGAGGAIPTIPPNDPWNLVALLVDPGKLPIESRLYK